MQVNWNHTFPTRAFTQLVFDLFRKISHSLSKIPTLNHRIVIYYYACDTTKEKKVIISKSGPSKSPGLEEIPLDKPVFRCIWNEKNTFRGKERMRLSQFVRFFSLASLVSQHVKLVAMKLTFTPHFEIYALELNL